MAVRQFSVEGMTCTHCEASVAEEVGAIAGVEDVAVDHTTGRLEVTGEGFSAEEVEKAVHEAGYRLT
ncbi:heavy-metal-associated domain-containing protein [Corynebacterium liangguodongii]|uniref:Oxidoreductase n=1 Tax=Corynebacterium liangguodongii TaxID=2079535 RepID=A0A2S0WGJ8_9CORY|nr:heavy metal-associated domain-containing protein [Corynebacterium liangguodongii]AWB84893.1 oxidoreductase [Corynebacterium liangguodongii]PWB99399.1 heavy-metal-associated domain-containing protein [Corynebacterium liangguodongii]